MPGWFRVVDADNNTQKACDTLAILSAGFFLNILSISCGAVVLLTNRHADDHGSISGDWNIIPYWIKISEDFVQDSSTHSV